MSHSLNPVIAQWQALRQCKSFNGLDDEAIQQQLLTLYQHKHGHFERWLQIIDDLPNINPSKIKLNQSTPQVIGEFTQLQHNQLVNVFKALMPWRKGPFQIGEMVIDSEWRSDFKYSRLQSLALDVCDKHILDVGTGNGYFLYRLLGSGAKLALGVDPSWHYFAQFLALQHYYSQTNAIYLPMSLDDVLLTDFDVTVSMGVLYHRRDPINFLWQLKETLRPGGHLVLETLVIEGDAQTVLMPESRYAGMRNVWFLPSILALKRWLTRLGFEIITQSEIVATTIDEQRRTHWMDRQSLADFISVDATQTIEGLPPPKRVIILAKKC